MKRIYYIIFCIFALSITCTDAANKNYLHAPDSSDTHLPVQVIDTLDRGLYIFVMKEVDELCPIHGIKMVIHDNWKKPRRVCKECSRERKRVYYLKNIEKFYEYNASRKDKKSAYNKEYSIKNKERLDEKRRKYRLENYDAIIERSRINHYKHKESRNKKASEWKRNNPDIVNAGKRKYYHEHKNDPRYKLDLALISKIKRSFSEGINFTILSESLPYSMVEMKNHLESTIEIGYCWEDYIDGRLQIDHIIPRCEFDYTKSTDDSFKECWSLKNLRLITKEENIKKGRNRIS